MAKSNSNNTPKGGFKQQIRKFVRFQLKLIIAVALLIIILKAVVIPFLIEPIVFRSLASIKQSISDKINAPVNLGYADLSVNLGFKGGLIEVSEPFVIIDKGKVVAKSASVLLRWNLIPELLINEVAIDIAQEQNGNLIANGITQQYLATIIETLPSVQEDLKSASIPVILVFHDAEISFTTKNDERYDFPRTTFAVSQGAKENLIQLDLRSTASEIFSYSAHADISLDNEVATIDFFVSVDNKADLMQEIGIDFDADFLHINTWGQLQGLQKLKFFSTATVQKAQLVAKLSVNDSEEVQNAQLQAGSLGVAIEMDVTNPLTNEKQVSATWSIEATDVLAKLPSHILGDQLQLNEVEGSGKLTFKDSTWQLGAYDTRFTGPIGTGHIDFDIGSNSDDKIFIDLKGSGTKANINLISNLLPYSIGEPGIRYLQESITTQSAQLNTIVIAGEDITGFPWPNDTGGRFKLQADVFGANLDYATGYPPLTNADASFGLSGTALAVTVSSGDIRLVKIGTTRAAIDDLAAAVSTVFLALEAQLPETALTDLLINIPATQKRVSGFINDIKPIGSQALKLTASIPIEEGKTQVSGSLEFLKGSKLNYLPATISIDDLSGSIKFENDNVNGITKGVLLGSGVRLSVNSTPKETLLLVDGSFDIAAALNELGKPTTFPITGKSALQLRTDGDYIKVISKLRGSKIDLPAPFGKTSDENVNLTVSLDNELISISYGNDFLKALINTEDDTSVIALGESVALESLPVSGTRVSGSLEFIDLDNLLPQLVGGDSDANINLPLEINLALPGAQLFGQFHPQFDANITLAGSATVAYINATGIEGEFFMGQGGTLNISLAHMDIQKNDAPRTDGVATVYVEAGTLSPKLPPIVARIDELTHGDHNYRKIIFEGKPENNTWKLNKLQALVGGNLIDISGQTNTEGDPSTSIMFKLELNDVKSFADNYFGDNKFFTAGYGNIMGDLKWDGSIIDPHFLSMQGTLTIGIRNLGITEGSSGAKFLNLLSPFSFLQSLPDIGKSGTQFDNTAGILQFSEGNLIFDNLAMYGNEIDISVGGSTNLITENIKMEYIVQLNSADSLTTGAVSLVNPLAGAFLLVFDKVLDRPLIGKPRLAYDITGTWDEPILTSISDSTQTPTDE